MATLRIPFPESEAPAVVVLRGPRITLGRGLDNTIQIRDRTVSAHHLELVEEGDHYRLHDLGATNGVLVDGQVVTDFHLRKECKISLGSVTCEFNPEVVVTAAADPALELVTRAECEALTREKAELAQQVTILREQVAAIERTHTAAPETAAVPQTEFDQLVAALAAAKQTLAERDRQIERLVASRGVLQRDRDNLQRLIEEEAEAPAAETAAPKPVQAQPVVAAVPVTPAVPVVPFPPAAKSAPRFVPPASPQVVPASPQLPKPPARLQPAAATPVRMSAMKPVAVATPVAKAVGPKGTQRIKV